MQQALIKFKLHANNCVAQGYFPRARRKNLDLENSMKMSSERESCTLIAAYSNGVNAV